MTSRHEFLYALHQLLKPRGYLEIGVQFGTSLRLASCPAIGVDPAPQIHGALGPNHRIFAETSDNFFAEKRDLPPIDLAFIDGMHRMEFALRDFMNVEHLATDRTVVVFDDVLPRNHGEAAREQCPGDWTGDVWKLVTILTDHYRANHEIGLLLVDTEPTGALVVYRRAPEGLGKRYDQIVESWISDMHVPGDILSRRDAISPDRALKILRDRHLLVGEHGPELIPGGAE